MAHKFLTLFFTFSPYLRTLRNRLALDRFFHDKLLFTDIAPTPTEAICKHFNELRSDLALALDLKNALDSCEFELQALRHQYEALNPGKVVT